MKKRKVDFQHIFDSLPGCILLLSPDIPRFTIIAVSDSFLWHSSATREEVIGKGVFDAFHNNQGEHGNKYEDLCRESFTRVVKNRTPDIMPVRKCEVPLPQSEGGGFTIRFWKSVNTPVSGQDGEVAYILHQVEDVTESMQRKHEGTYPEVSNIDIRESRSAALNLIRDAVESRQMVERTNETLRKEIEVRQIAEAALISNDKLLKSVLDNVNSGVALIDDTGRFSVFNPLFLKLFGLSESSTINNVNDQNWALWEVYSEGGSLLNVDEHPIRKAALTGKRINQQLVGVKLPSGKKVTWMLISAEPFFKENGDVDKIICTYHDITNRKKAEEALRESEERLRLAQESAAVGIWDWKVESGSLNFTSELNNLYGLPPGTIKTYQDWRDLVHPDDIVLIEMQRDEAIAKHQPFDLEFRGRHSSGEYRWISTKGGAIYGEAGKTIRVLGVNIDITDRKKAEEAVQRKNAILDGINRIFSAALLSSTVEELGSVCLEIAQELTQSKFGFIGDINESGLEDIAISNPGWDACNILNESGHSAKIGSFKIHGIYGKVISHGESFFTNDPTNHQDHIGLPDGHPPLEAFLGVPLRDDGRVTGIIALGNRPGGYSLSEQETLETLAPVVVEVFKRKRVEEERMESEKEKKKLATILEMSSQPFAIGMPDGSLGYHNKEFESLTGYTAGELKTLSWDQNLTPPEYSEMEREILGKLIETKKTVRYEKEYFRKDGSRVPIELLVNFVADQHGKPEYYYTFLTDITQRKKYEQNLHQLIRTLRAMQKSSLMMAQATDEQKFLQDVCSIIVEDCGHKMVWIGYKENDRKKSVRPVAHAGFEDHYLESLNITWSDTKRGQGPTGMAIRTKQPSLCRNMATDPAFLPWRKDAIKNGYSSSIVLPLNMDGEVFGVINIYSREADPFSKEEQQLLTKLADDLAYGVKTIRLNLALQQARENLEAKVSERTSLLQKTLKDLSEERQRFQDVLNMIPAYVALITPENNISFANKIFRETFGEPENKHCYEILFGRSEKCDICGKSKLPGPEKPYKWEGTGINGKTYQVSDFAFQDIDGSPLILEMGVDITEQRNMEKMVMSKILETEERDRRLFARDLHDDLGPTLSAIRIQLSMLVNEQNNSGRTELLNICDELLSDSIEKMRTLANNIMPSLIETYGVETAIHSFINKMEKSCQISCSFSSNLDDCRFEMETEMHLYRIITELFNNTIKHSGAQNVYIRMEATNQDLLITYSDDGIGYNVNNIHGRNTGIGLQNIMNRVNLLNGTIDFLRIEGKTLVEINIPLPE